MKAQSEDTCEVPPEVKSLFKKYLNMGTMTHVYGGYHNYSSREKSWSYSVLPEHRDVFDLASITKAVVTTPLIFSMFQKGELDLKGSVGSEFGRILPKNLDKRYQALKILDILNHSSGLPAWQNFWVECFNDIQTNDVCVRGLNRAANYIMASGVQKYSDVGFILLGRLLELTHNRPLDVLWRSFLIDTILVDNNELLSEVAEFCPSQKARCIPTGYCNIRHRMLIGEVHDENCAILGGVAGHAGLFGSGDQLTNFLDRLAKSTLGQEVIKHNAEARGNPMGMPSPEGLIGWRQGADKSSMGFGSGMAIGHLGFTGVAFWLRPEHEDFAVLLTNRVLNGRFTKGIADFRREFFLLCNADR